MTCSPLEKCAVDTPASSGQATIILPFCVALAFPFLSRLKLRRMRGMQRRECLPKELREIPLRAASSRNVMRSWTGLSNSALMLLATADSRNNVASVYTVRHLHLMVNLSRMDTIESLWSSVPLTV